MALVFMFDLFSTGFFYALGYLSSQRITVGRKTYLKLFLKNMKSFSISIRLHLNTRESVHDFIALYFL